MAIYGENRRKELIIIIVNLIRVIMVVKLIQVQGMHGRYDPLTHNTFTWIIMNCMIRLEGRGVRTHILYHKGSIAHRHKTRTDIWTCGVQRSIHGTSGDLEESIRCNMLRGLRQDESLLRIWVVKEKCIDQGTKRFDTPKGLHKRIITPKSKSVRVGWILSIHTTYHGVRGGMRGNKAMHA